MTNRKCGVNQNLYKKYEFDDHIWKQNSGVRGDLLQLTQKCVKIDSTYWFKKIGGDHWIPIKSIIDAKKEAFSTWLGGTLPSGKIIDEALINTFFDGIEQVVTGIPPKIKYVPVQVGSCPNVCQKMVIPMGPQFITYKGQSYLNVWYNDMIDGEKENLRLGKLVLMMCYGALCNGQVDRTKMEAEADRIYNMVVKNDYDNIEFKFFMNWIASIVQSPGINLQTNLWLIGPVQGLGKGTIVDIMRHILGSEFVGELNQVEIEAGWNDHLVGLQLVEVNEFDSSNKRGMSGQAWGKWLKGHTIEPSLKIRERNKTAYNVLHIGNFLGTSNNIEQTFIDANDRRNQFIRTTSDTYWVQFATALQLKYFKVKPKDVASGFAYILDQVKVDFEFIAKAHKNEFRNSIASNSKSVIEEWIELDGLIDQNKWIAARDLYDRFKNWHRDSRPGQEIITETKWGREMGLSAYLGIRKKCLREGNQYIFEEPPKSIEHKLEESVTDINQISKDTDSIVVYDLDVVDPKTKAPILSPMEKMRARLKEEMSSHAEGKDFLD